VHQGSYLLSPRLPPTQSLHFSSGRQLALQDDHRSVWSQPPPFLPHDPLLGRPPSGISCVLLAFLPVLLLLTPPLLLLSPLTGPYGFHLSRPFYFFFSFFTNPLFPFPFLGGCLAFPFPSFRWSLAPWIFPWLILSDVLHQFFR